MNLSSVHLYVSVNGSDLNDGTINSPFATLCKARLIVRSLNREGHAVTVLVREGTYYLEETLRFSTEDSGTDRAPISYEAYPGEKVVISGGIKLDLQWNLYEGAILKAETPQGMRTDQLFVNGQQLHMARYPNYSPDVHIFNGYAADCLDPERTSRWSDPSGGYIHAMHKHLWGDYHYQFTSRDQEGNLLYEGGWQNNRQMGMHDKYRYVENIAEELDAPGEWYLDEKVNILYVYPDPETDLQCSNLEVVRLPHLIEFIGTQANPVQHISFKGFTFRHAARTFMQNREPLLRSDWTIYRGGSVFFEGAEDCGIEDCHFDQVGGNAVFVNCYNRRITIRGCHISDAGANGVAFVGDPSSVRSPLFEYHQRQKLSEIDTVQGPLNDNYPSDCIVDDCLIYRSGRVEKQSAAVQISMSIGITVRHCSIYDVPRAGINISEGTWGGHVIEHCDVFDTVLETGDHGSFNSWGRDRYWGLMEVNLDELNNEVSEERSKLPVLDVVQPVIIRNNRWRCDYGWDIDLDDGSTLYHIYNNLCLAGGIKLREGFYRICENNIMVNNSFHPHVWFRGSRDIFRRNIVFADYQPIRVSKPWGEESDWNILHVPGAEGVRPAEVLQLQSGLDVHSLIADALFLDPAAGDYRVQEDSPALQLGFQNFVMDQFGVQKPELKALARSPKLPVLGMQSGHSNRHAKIVRWDKCKIKNIVGMGEISAAGLPEETGIILETIPWDSWQMEAGLQVGDVVLGLNGQKVDIVEDLLSLYQTIVNGEKFMLTLFRGQLERVVECAKR